MVWPGNIKVEEKKDRLVTQVSSHFFGTMTLNMLAGREADAGRCLQMEGGWNQGS